MGGRRARRVWPGRRVRPGRGHEGVALPAGEAPAMRGGAPEVRTDNPATAIRGGAPEVRTDNPASVASPDVDCRFDHKWCGQSFTGDYVESSGASFTTSIPGKAASSFLRRDACRLVGSWPGAVRRAEPRDSPPSLAGTLQACECAPSLALTAVIDLRGSPEIRQLPTALRVRSKDRCLTRESGGW